MTIYAALTMRSQVFESAARENVALYPLTASLDNGIAEGLLMARDMLTVEQAQTEYRG